MENCSEDDFKVLSKCASPLALVYDPLKAGSIDRTDTEPHDRAISRALYSDYKPNKRLSSDPESTLFVARLHKKTTEETLTREFSQYGPIKSCHLVRDIVTGASKCYAFVEFVSKKDASLAYRRANSSNIDGMEVLVDFECERLLPGWIPRRLGGGFGGKKESGQLRFGGRARPFKKPINMLFDKETNMFPGRSRPNMSYKRSRDHSDDRNYHHSKR
ncbi:hypothetical protein LSTR_LSTR009390 [Laodelphax striatellus]|uniref:U11/U12 small nuclear ribonucleoprotein 35 kDa protein n=1 Tax=Laodelphax striatellus TaxID=195883 RepID=A0A482WH26_LAOST|nr:hypothetical protein LSTR_LSTR009390 [Laodelphax striatellus]